MILGKPLRRASLLLGIKRVSSISVCPVYYIARKETFLAFFLKRYSLLTRPLRQVKLHILVHQERNPSGGQYPYDPRYDTAVEAPPALFGPRPLDDSSNTSSEPRVGVVVLESAADDLVRVGGGTSDQLGDAGDDDGRFVAHSLLLLLLLVTRLRLRPGEKAASPPARKVQPLDGVVDGELDGAVNDADQANAQAAVEAAPPLAPQQARGAGPHARVRARGAAVRRYHARLHDPDRVREDLRADARGAGREEVVARRQRCRRAIRRRMRLRLERQQGALGPRLEEEEGRPARRVAQQVRRQPPVQRGDGVRRPGERADQRDGGGRRLVRTRCAALVDWKRGGMEG